MHKTIYNNFTIILMLMTYSHSTMYAASEPLKKLTVQEELRLEHAQTAWEKIITHEGFKEFIAQEHHLFVCDLCSYIMYHKKSAQRHGRDIHNTPFGREKKQNNLRALIPFSKKIGSTSTKFNKYHYHDTTEQPPLQIFECKYGDFYSLSQASIFSHFKKHKLAKASNPASMMCLKNILN